ncbi:MAG: MgtC/SapB family protein [Gemmatimonadetes bacterium]|nr:MgtC/SapB family protein [Gemmatimonadota bacterium]MCA9763209.1 MgtC/SapB family protein [Gemmatimonadota bacterium]MCB9505733.1 MgtC/SapB family protein [Gemmatimonadales bacterium]MCB9518868.1 MgtC/SapB family protein [Gemmatimonadales bacterium]
MSIGPRLTPTEVLLRLGLGTLFGAVLGFDRERQEKPAGLKTLALVGLGGAMAPVVMLHTGSADPNPVSRVIQGVLTGVGFLGAGVIMHRKSSGAVEGLTTAAVIWVVAAVGLAAGMGQFIPAGAATGIALLVLTVGKRLERRLDIERDD